MKTIHTIKAFTLILLTALMSVSVTVWAEDVTPSVTLTSYYSAANGKASDALRTALQGIIGNHTVVSYDNLGTLMQYSDTEEANGKDVIDMYTTCTYSVTGAITWISSGDVGDGMNREHTAPQSWFGKASPMVSDAFHIFPTDAKANNNRSSYLYGEFSGTGRSYSTSKCTESGKLSNGDSGKKTIASYTYKGTTYSPTASYTGIVYEPADEYKGDIARGYFYLATRYASGSGTANCSNWSGGAFGSDNNGFTNYTAELMLKWHRQDPVSRKELIRNEVIYGNTKYNKSNKKQGNRNPFIDYPELVEYIWGNKKGQNVTIADLTSAYEEAGTGTPTTTYNVSLWRHGNTQVVTGLTGDYTLPTTGEADACKSWVFDGWSSSKVTSTTTKPTTYITKATSSTGTAYAVYKKEPSSGGAPIRKAMMGTSTVASVTFSNANSDGSADKSSSIADLVESVSGISSYSGTKVYAGTTGVKIGTGSATGSITLNLSSAANVKSVVVNAKKYGSDSGTLSVTAGSSAVGNAQNPNATAGDLTFTATNAVTNTTTITVATSSKRAYIKSITVIAEDGGSTTTYTYDSDPSDCKCSGKLGTPAVTATPSDGTITLTWADVDGATNGYTVTISKGTGYTTECGDVEIGDITHSGSTNTCVITGLVNGLSYTTSVTANATATTCDSDADQDTATPIGCTAWDDPTLTYTSYTLTAGGSATAAPTVGAGHGTLTFSSSNTDVLTVAADGKVTPKSAGTATVTASWTGADGYCPKDVTSQTFTVNGKVTVTFNANDGSGSPATKTQQVDWNTATALTANTFTRTGYTFLGWDTNASATTATYTDGASVTFTAATTLYAIWQVNSHQVSYVVLPAAGATVQINSSATAPQNANYGSTVTISISPAAHYTLTSVTAKDADNGNVTVSGSGNTRTLVMPDKNVTVTVTMTEETKFTVNWIVNGISKKAEQNYAGEALTGLATAPTSADCDDSKVFMGWTATQISGESATAPNDLFTDASTKTMPSNNTTNYYAVFATASSSNSSKTYTLELTGNNFAGSYNERSASATANEVGGTGTLSVSFTSNGVMKSSNSGNPIQFRKSGSGAGVLYNTTDLGTINSITYGSGSTNNIASTYKGTSAQPTSDGTGGYFKITNGSSVSYITSITINFTKTTGGGTSYSEYATSCTHESTVTITFNANFGGGTMAAQVVNWGEATNLNANTFTAPTGHHFLGWSESSTATTATYENQGSVTYKKDVTLYAIWEANSHQVSYEVVPAGKATVQINSSATTPQNVNYGTTVTVAVSPDTHYSLTSITLSTGGSVAVNGNSGTFTMPDDNVKVTVTVTEDTKYTVTWDVAGSTSTETHYAGVALTGIDAPTSDDCDGSKVFVGWTAHEDYENETTAPDDLFTDPTTKTTPANNTTTYYAVFAEENNGGGSGELINEEFDNTSSSDASSAISTTTFANFSGATDKAYKSKHGGLKFGSSSASGYITTKSLDLSTAFTVALDVRAYGSTSSDGGDVYVQVADDDGTKQLIEDGDLSISEFRHFELSFSAATSSSAIEIGTTSKRAYIDNVVITAGSGSSYSNYATSCEIPENVTVKFDANGGEGTMADQTIPYNTATKLTKNTFTREGYDFQGWATTASGAKAYDDEEQVTFKKKTTTLYAVWAIKTYNITVVVDPTEGGTASTTPANKAEFGQNVTVNVSADSHYDLTSIVVTKAGGGEVTVTNKQFTMPAEAVTVTVTFTKKTVYTVTWSQNGDESTKVEYIQGETIAFPASATVDCDDKVFIGWSTEAFTETDDAPTTMINSATMGTSNLIYYAVYANAGSGSGSGSGSGDYELVESAPTNWAGDYLIAYSSTKFADGRVGGKDASGSIGAEGISVNPGENLSGKVVAATWGDTYNVTIVESATAGKYLLQTKDGKYNYHTGNSNGLSATDSKSTAENYPLTITFSSSSDIDIAIAAGAVFHYNTQGYFRFYKDGGQSSIYLYRKGSGSGGGGSGSSYTGYTTSCGASISAKSGKWLTAANGQKVKTAIEVKARGFDAATTLSASSDNGNFSVSLAATTVPVEGLTTTLTIEYMPASVGATESGTITLTAGDVTKTITVNGRSLPDEFLIITKKDSKWYALPANMTGKAGLFDGVEVTPDNTTTPTAVATSPSTVVYNLKAVASGRYATAGNCVRLVGNNNLCLYGSLDADATGIHNNTKLTEANAANTEWLLTTTDGVQYTIANPNHADYAEGRILAYGTQFGQFKMVTTFYIVSTGCNSKPENVRVGARRADATFSWVSNATEMKIDVYKNSAMTGKPYKFATTTASPYTMSGLDQETDYWYKLTPNSSDVACAVTGTFRTYGPTIDVVEWKEDAAVILVDKPEDMHPIITIAGEEEHGNGTGIALNATELFFAKYFEGAGDMKLLSIYNGTENDISLAKYSIFMYCIGNSNNTHSAQNDKTYDLSGLGTIKSGQEIIFFTRPLSTQAIYSCSNTFLNNMAAKSGADENPRWIECDGSKSYGGKVLPKFDFSGNDPLYLKKDGEIIDIFGSKETPPTTNNCRGEKAWAGTIQNMDYHRSPSDTVFNAFYDASSKSPVTTSDSIALLNAFGINLDDSIISVHSGRCVLFRYKEVVSGENAVTANSGASFGSFTSDEWRGRTVCVANSTYADAGVTDDSPSTCNSYQDLGSFNYSDYYKNWVDLGGNGALSDYAQGVETGTENLYEIPITNLDKYTCLQLQFNLIGGEDDGDDKGKLLASTNAKVPIIVSGTHSTTDAIFNEIVKDDNDNPLYLQSIARCAECEVLVLNGATLTKAADGATHDVPQVGDLTIYPGGTLVVPTGTNYTVNTLTYRVENERVPTSELQGNFILNPLNTQTDKKLLVTRRIKNDRYYFFSLPYDCALSDVHWANSNTPARLNVDFRLREYDGETRAAEGSYIHWPGHWKDIEGDVIKAGKGYNIAVSTSKPKELVFPMAVPKDNLTQAEIAKHQVNVPLEEFEGYFTALDDNWNLIAHPYLTSFDATAADAVDVEWEHITRPDIDDPTQGGDDPTGEVVERGTVENGIDWTLYADGTMVLTGGGQMVDFSSLDAVPWAGHRQFIQNVKIGGEVQKIGKYAFGQCTNLTNVIIAAPVANLASQAFAGCTGLRTFRIESTQYVSATTTTFDGISSLTMISLQVPQSMYSQYSAQTPWSKMSISAFDEGSTTGGDGTNTSNPAPRRDSGSGDDEPIDGLYAYVPTFNAGAITYSPILLKNIDDIPPFIAVFIQGSGPGSLTFTQAASAPVRHDAAFLRARSVNENASIFVGVVIEGNGYSDQTALRLRPNYAGGYKTGHDLLKFATFNTERPQIYMHTDTCRLAFRAVKDKTARENWLPVGVYCRDAGTYTFSLNDRYPIDEVEAVYLHDAETGTTTNLLLSNYSIETTQQLYTNTRFSINVLLRRKKVEDTPTVINHTGEDSNAPRKFFRDGLLYILRNGKVYDMTGKPVQFDDMLNR